MAAKANGALRTGAAKRAYLPILVVLLVATGSFWFYEQKQTEKDFRASSLEELKRAVGLFRQAQAETALVKIYDNLVTESIRLIQWGGTKLYEERRKSWLEHKIAECEAEADLRRQMSILEVKLKRKNAGLLPPWIIQERDWQIIDDHIRKSKVTMPGGGCREKFEEIERMATAK